MEEQHLICWKNNDLISRSFISLKEKDLLPWIQLRIVNVLLKIKSGRTGAL